MQRPADHRVLCMLGLWVPLRDCRPAFPADCRTACQVLPPAAWHPVTGRRAWPLPWQHGRDPPGASRARQSDLSARNRGVTDGRFHTGV